MTAKRTSETVRTARSGCYTCHGSAAYWLGRNAVGVAVQHHDRTGHRTWCEQSIRTTYGAAEAEAAHPDLFELQAAS